MAINITNIFHCKALQYLPELGLCHKNYQHLSLQDTPKVSQIGIFGLKIYHLATLVPFQSSRRQERRSFVAFQIADRQNVDLEVAVIHM
jgi:hypothetical protein